jgi:tetratricopeptide (TPR) repeat protein
MKKNLLMSFLFLSLMIPFAFAQETTTEAEQQMEATQSGDFEKAMRFYRQKRYSDAIAEFERVVASDPNNAAAYYMLGYAHYVQDHHSEALAAFAKAFQANPNFDPRPYFGR